MPQMAPTLWPFMLLTMILIITTTKTFIYFIDIENKSYILMLSLIHKTEMPTLLWQW